MHDNKLRLSPDIIAKAEEIAQTWGLKNSRAAIEAVFRKYADDYQYGRQPMMAVLQGLSIDGTPMMPSNLGQPVATMAAAPSSGSPELTCDALNELDSLIGF